MTPVEKLGELLLQRGLITPVQLADCLKDTGRGTETALSDLIVSRGIVDRETMNQAIQSLQGPAWVSIADPVAPAAPKESATPPEVLEARKDPKRVLQKYTLLHELGRGGMAVVYRAWDDFLKKDVALKLIRSQDIGITDAAKEGEIQEFLREARTAIKLSHPNIVRVYELGCHDDRYFLSMECIEGKNLEAMLHPNRRQSPWQEFYAQPRRFLIILRDVASALQHAHQQVPPIVHRDVKPQNILVDGHGKACVVDFGLAKEMTSGSTLTVSGIVKGTPCYMAPEQALGRTGKGVDARTDVWALGAILYEYLTGVPPFTGPTQREILNKVVHEEPVPPSALQRSRGWNVHVPPALEKVCLKALEKDKTKRYASAAEFARELDRYLGGGTVRARGVAGYERAWRRAAKNRAVVLPVAAAVVMSVVAAVALMRKSEPQKIVEKVVVEGAADARLREATQKIQSIASDMKYDQARRAYQELIGSLEGGKEKDALRGELEEIRLQQALIQDLTLAIRQGPRTYTTFQLKDRTLDEVRVLDATSDVLIVRHSDRGLEIPWVQLSPSQFASMAYEFRTVLGSEASLGFISWCLRHKRPDEALVMAQDLRGKPGEATAKRLLGKAGLQLEPERAPEPVVKAPEPPPTPKERPVTRRVENPEPPSKPPPSEVNVPAAATWTYVPEWKNHGLPLATELLRRGWDDLAEEIALNLRSDPEASERARNDAVILRARIWTEQAARASTFDEAVEKVTWAVKTLEDLLGGSSDREVRIELAGLYGTRGRTLLLAGRTSDALAAFQSLEKNAKARVDRLERSGKSPREEWVQAKLSQALAVFSQAEAMRTIPGKSYEAKTAFERLVTLIDTDVLWEIEDTAAGLHASLLRSAACSILNRREVVPPATVVQSWLRDPVILRTDAARWLLPRAYLLQTKTARPAWSERQFDTAATRQACERLAESIEDFFRKVPAAKEGEIGTALRLELARCYLRAGKHAAATGTIRVLAGPGTGADVPVKIAAMRILKEIDTPDAKKLAAELGVSPAENDLPISLAFLQAAPYEAALPSPSTSSRLFAMRASSNRESLVTRGGGTRATEAAVLHSLKWLARHQGPDGGWGAETFQQQCVGGRCGGPGERDFDTGVTGLALLAFLGAGYTPASKDEYPDDQNPGRRLRFGEVVRKGLQYIIAHQDPEGCIGERGMKYMYNHAVGGLALVEAAGMMNSFMVREAAQKAVDFTVAAQNPGKGWRYSAKCGDNDTSVTGWGIQMLRAAEISELNFPKLSADNALSWLNEATEVSGYYQVGYNQRGTGKVYVPGKNEQFDHHATMTGVGVLSRIFIQKRKSDSALQGVNLLVSDMAEWKTNKIDFYYWYYSSAATFQYDGPDGQMWKRWNEFMKNALVPNQKTAKDGCRSGSWDPDQERWGAEGGRVYGVALNALTLETYYRYMPLIELPKKK